MLKPLNVKTVINVFVIAGYRSGVDEVQLQRLLNFAVGSLLGDVFLHLLPEAWNHARGII